MLYTSNILCDVQDALLYLNMSAVMQPPFKFQFLQLGMGIEFQHQSKRMRLGFIVVMDSGAASEVGHSDSCFCRGIEMVLLAVKCRQVFEMFQAYAQGVPVTDVKYLLPYLIVLGFLGVFCCVEL
jgi:hypothetical protein